MTLITPMSPEEFARRYTGTGTPVVLRGLLRDWPAVTKWTPNYLAQVTSALGDIQVQYRSTPSDMAKLEMARIQRGTMSLRELLAEIQRSPEEGDELYVPGLSLPPGSPLARDVAMPSVLAASDVYATTVFFGRNTQCIGHFHPRTQALLGQVQGVKRIWMYPPSELRRLYLFPLLSPGFFRSQVNFYGDRSQFPRLSEAKGELFELHPGDALFIPLHWLHVPEGKGWNVSVTNWWRPRLREWTFSAASARSLIGIGLELGRRMKGRWRR